METPKLLLLPFATHFFWWWSWEKYSNCTQHYKERWRVSVSLFLTFKYFPRSTYFLGSSSVYLATPSHINSFKPAIKKVCPKVANVNHYLGLGLDVNTKKYVFWRSALPVHLKWRNKTAKTEIPRISKKIALYSLKITPVLIVFSENFRFFLDQMATISTLLLLPIRNSVFRKRSFCKG